MKTATLGQVRKVLELLDDVPQEQVQAVLGSGLLSDLLSANVAEVDRAEFRKACGLRPLAECQFHILPIDRTRPFDPVKFLGKGWSIVEEDERSLALTQLDPTKIRLEHMLKKGEISIKGGERLRRLKEAGYIRLDAKIFQTLWENRAFIPESWKHKDVYFDGTVLRNPENGLLYALRFCGGGGWGSYWLEYDRDARNPSVVLVSV
jgi:hypothetical protein